MLKLLAHTTNLKEKELVISFGDVHVYQNHISFAEEQLELFDKFNRKDIQYPKVNINRKNNLKDYSFDDIVLKDYSPIELKGKLEVAV